MGSKPDVKKGNELEVPTRRRAEQVAKIIGFSGLHIALQRSQVPPWGDPSWGRAAGPQGATGAE